MKKCVECGALCEDRASRCRVCGARLPAAGAGEEQDAAARGGRTGNESDGASSCRQDARQGIDRRFDSPSGRGPGQATLILIIVVLIITVLVLTAALLHKGRDGGGNKNKQPQPTPPIQTLAPAPTPTPTPAPTPTPTPKPTPAPTPSPKAPGPDDIRGCNERVVHPRDTWLSDYETKYVKTKHGVRAYLRYEPKEDSGYYDFVYEKDKVTVLARQNGYSLVKTTEGTAGWVTSSVLVDKY